MFDFRFSNQQATSAYLKQVHLKERAVHDSTTDSASTSTIAVPPPSVSETVVIFDEQCMLL